MPTIDASVGLATSNAYNTEAELDAVAAATYPEPAWVDLSADQRQRAMITAARLIDTVVVPGQRVLGAQALEHPRLGLLGYRSVEIAAPVKLAHALTTFFLTGQAADANPFNVGDFAGISSMAFGSELNMRFDVGATSLSAWQVFLRDVIAPILGRLVLDPAYTSSLWSSGPRSVRNPYSTAGDWTSPRIAAR